MSIQTGLSGLSFCVKDTASNSFEHYIEHPTLDNNSPESLLKDLINAFESNPALQTEFDSVRVIHDNALSSIVPLEILDPEKLGDYLKFNVALLPDDFVAYDELNNLNCAVVFVPFVNINNYVYEHFGSFEYHHQSSILLQRLQSLSANDDEKVLRLHIQEKYFEAICFKGNQLICYNRFNHQTPHDFLFYLLFLVEQLGLDPEKVTCELFGKVDEMSPCYKEAYKYIRHTNLLEPKVETNFSNLKKNFVALNSF